MLPHQCWDYKHVPSIDRVFGGSWGLNLSPHYCVASTLPIELYLPSLVTFFLGLTFFLLYFYLVCAYVCVHVQVRVWVGILSVRGQLVEVISPYLVCFVPRSQLRLSLLMTAGLFICRTILLTLICLEMSCLLSVIVSFM